MKAAQIDQQVEELWRAFGRWIAAEREKRGLTQERVAEMAGMKRQQWHRLEQGQSTTRKTVLRIANALQITPDEALVRAGFQSPAALDSDIAALFYKYPKLTEKDKEEIKALLQVVDREIDRRLLEVPR
jgi:transcriptional regulator with XRE-family HTH domain